MGTVRHLIVAGIAGIVTVAVSLLADYLVSYPSIRLTLKRLTW